MNEDSQSSQNDGFGLIDKVNRKYFSEIEHSVLHYQQTLFDFQNESYKAWKNTVIANVQLQKEMCRKSGFYFILPEISKTIIENLGDEITKYRLACNKIAIATIESGTKNVKTLNNNAETFVDLNRKIMHFWLSGFLSKSITEK
ncbi:MAG: hypothetical protein ACE5DU_02515 [Nitrosopumilus sp.]